MINELKTVRDALEYLTEWQSKDGGAVVVEVASEALTTLDALIERCQTPTDTERAKALAALDEMEANEYWRRGDYSENISIIRAALSVPKKEKTK